MFDYIKGVLVEKTIGAAVIEAGGVGYSLIIPLSSYEMLPAPGQEVKVLTHHYVREDAEKLYGFFTKGEREIFRQLIGISKIGPKTAISILSGVSAGDFIECVNKCDASRLRRIPGVGDKTAQRLVMELKGKLCAPQEVGERAAESFSVNGPMNNPRSEAFDAMISLGYVEKQVLAALARVETVVDKSAPAETWIKRALQVI